MGTHVNEYQEDETKSGNYIVMYDIDIDKISVCMAMYNGDTCK